MSEHLNSDLQKTTFCKDNNRQYVPNTFNIENDDLEYFDDKINYKHQQISSRQQDLGKNQFLARTSSQLNSQQKMQMMTVEKRENKSSQPKGRISTSKHKIPNLDLNQLKSNNQVYDYSNLEIEEFPNEFFYDAPNDLQLRNKDNFKIQLNKLPSQISNNFIQNNLQNSISSQDNQQIISNLNQDEDTISNCYKQQIFSDINYDVQQESVYNCDQQILNSEPEFIDQQTELLNNKIQNRQQQLLIELNLNKVNLNNEIENYQEYEQQRNQTGNFNFNQINSAYNYDQNDQFRNHDINNFQIQNVEYQNQQYQINSTRIKNQPQSFLDQQHEQFYQVQSNLINENQKAIKYHTNKKSIRVSQQRLINTNTPPNYGTSTVLTITNSNNLNNDGKRLNQNQVNSRASQLMQQNIYAAVSGSSLSQTNMYRSSYTAVFPKPSAEKIQYLYDQIHLNIFETFKLVEQEFKWSMEQSFDDVFFSYNEDRAEKIQFLKNQCSQMNKISKFGRRMGGGTGGSALQDKYVNYNNYQSNLNQSNINIDVGGSNHNTIAQQNNFQSFKDNLIALEILDQNVKFNFKDFTHQYAEKIVQNNLEFEEISFIKNNLYDKKQNLSVQEIEKTVLENNLQIENKDIISISLINANIFPLYLSYQNKKEDNSNLKAIDDTTNRSYDPNNSAKLRVYVYIDDQFEHKTEIYGQSNTPILDLRLNINLPENAQEIRFDMYDAQNLSLDEQIKIKNYSQQVFHQLEYRIDNKKQFEDQQNLQELNEKNEDEQMEFNSPEIKKKSSSKKKGPKTYIECSGKTLKNAYDDSFQISESKQECKSCLNNDGTSNNSFFRAGSLANGSNVISVERIKSTQDAKQKPYGSSRHLLDLPQQSDNLRKQKILDYNEQKVTPFNQLHNLDADDTDTNLKKEVFQFEKEINQNQFLQQDDSDCQKLIYIGTTRIKINKIMEKILMQSANMPLNGFDQRNRDYNFRQYANNLFNQEFECIQNIIYDTRTINFLQQLKDQEFEQQNQNGALDVQNQESQNQIQQEQKQSFLKNQIAVQELENLQIERDEGLSIGKSSNQKYHELLKTLLTGRISLKFKLNLYTDSAIDRLNQIKQKQLSELEQQLNLIESQAFFKSKILQNATRNIFFTFFNSVEGILEVQNIPSSSLESQHLEIEQQNYSQESDQYYRENYDQHENFDEIDFEQMQENIQHEDRRATFGNNYSKNQAQNNIFHPDQSNSPQLIKKQGAQIRKSKMMSRNNKKSNASQQSQFNLLQMNQQIQDHYIQHNFYQQPMQQLDTQNHNRNQNKRQNKQNQRYVENQEIVNDLISQNNQTTNKKQYKNHEAMKGENMMRLKIKQQNILMDDNIQFTDPQSDDRVIMQSDEENQFNDQSYNDQSIIVQSMDSHSKKLGFKKEQLPIKIISEIDQNDEFQPKSKRQKIIDVDEEKKYSEKDLQRRLQEYKQSLNNSNKFSRLCSVDRRMCGGYSLQQCSSYIPQNCIIF